MRDARTTPRHLQVPVLLGIATLAWYLLMCVPHAMSSDAPRWSALGNWKMFTTKSTTHYDLRATAKVDGEWVPTDLAALFPSTWDSGPRYARPSFFQDEDRVRVLAAALCGRDPRAPAAVRLAAVTWPARPGEPALPARDATVHPLLQWSCAAPPPVPPVPSL